MRVEVNLSFTVTVDCEVFIVKDGDDTIVYFLGVEVARIVPCGGKHIIMNNGVAGSLYESGVTEIVKMAVRDAVYKGRFINVPEMRVELDWPSFVPEPSGAEKLEEGGS